VVDLVIGLAILNLLNSVMSRTVRGVGRTRTAY